MGLIEEIDVDNFACGGGTSLGMRLALGKEVDIAINHDEIALTMHRVNHPFTTHLCDDVWGVNIREVTRGRRVNNAWFSPDCTDHSKAKGSRPTRSKEIRGLAWVVLKWAGLARPRKIFLENVEEFAKWGPLRRGRPVKSKRGMTFTQFVSQLRDLGYVVEYRELVCADYGIPTSRKRLFLIARCDGQPIVWPEKTHGPGLKPYKAAASIIDWSIDCPSIFLTKEQAKVYGVRRPLAENTMNRIARGIARYVVENARPFIVPVTHSADSRTYNIDEPLRTMTTSKGGEFALVSPLIVGCAHGEGQGRGVSEWPATRPLGTVLGSNNHALVAAFLAKHYGGHETPGSDMADPVSAITARDHHSLVTSHLLKLKGTSKDGQPVTEPLHTVQAQGNHYGEVRAFLLKYYGTATGADLREPLDTATARGRFGLIMVRGELYQIADIGMRMLTPRELFRAHGFPDSYVIDPVARKFKRGKWVHEPLTKEEQTYMVGNSVPPKMAELIVGANNNEALLGQVAA